MLRPYTSKIGSRAPESVTTLTQTVESTEMPPPSAPKRIKHFKSKSCQQPKFQSVLRSSPQKQSKEEVWKEQPNIEQLFALQKRMKAKKNNRGYYLRIYSHLPSTMGCE